MDERRHPWPPWIPLALAAVLGTVGAWAATSTVSGQRNPAGSRSSSPSLAEPVFQQSIGVRARAEDLSQAFREAAQAVLPAVVVIKAPDETACPHCGRVHPDSEWDHGGVSPQASGAVPRKHPLAVLGSGFIVDASGLIVTNQHVVASSHRIVVQLSDGQQFKAAKIKGDPSLDLAILKIEAHAPLPAARLADSEAVEIGDWVLAIGCPLELEQTVSAGIISAKNRSFCRNHRTRMLQTDAAINPGSSGGPLVNLAGQVVGVTTSIASEDGGYQGIGFAVPANHATKLLAQAGNERSPGRGAQISQHRP